jgi:hypothetical protein
MRRLQRASGKKKAGDWHGDHDEYVRELAREMLTGIPAWHKVTMEMQYGSDHQSEALEAFGKFVGEEVQSVGLIRHPSLTYLAASPDGLLLQSGVEAKVPLLKTHMDTMIEDVIPEEYIPQIATNMLCTKRESWWFISYCPKDPIDDERLMLPDDLRLFAKQVYVDDLTWKKFDGTILKGEQVFREIEEAATATIEEALALVKKLSSRRLVQV